MGSISPAIASTTGVNADLVAVLALGAAALIIFTVVYIVEKQVSATFSRIFALIVVAVLGVGLGFASIADSARTAGFTLLGTIAGYLAGTKTQTATSSHPSSNDQALMHVSGAVGTPGHVPPHEHGPVDTFL